VFENVELLCVDMIFVVDIGNFVVGVLMFMMMLCGMMSVDVKFEVFGSLMYLGMFGGLVLDLVVGMI